MFTSHHVPDMTVVMQLPWERLLPYGNGRCLATARIVYFSSYGRLEAERVNQF